jgi:hypothetical protein
MEVVRNRQVDKARVGGVFVMVVGAVTFTLGAIGVSSAGATKPNPDHKVTLCHRTASYTNPYVVITVDVASVLHEGHDSHNGPIFFDGIPKHTKWGDIIPPFDFGPGEQYAGKNWSADGQAILAAGCQLPSATTTSSSTTSTTVESTTTAATTTSTVPGDTTTSTTIESETTTTGGDTTTTVTSFGSTTPTGGPTVIPEGTTGHATTTTMIAAGPSGILPFTGTPVMALLGVGIVLTAAGLALARRRRYAG